MKKIVEFKNVEQNRIIEQIQDINNKLDSVISKMDLYARNGRELNTNVKREALCLLSERNELYMRLAKANHVSDTQINEKLCILEEKWKANQEKLAYLYEKQINGAPTSQPARRIYFYEMLLSLAERLLASINIGEHEYTMKIYREWEYVYDIVFQEDVDLIREEKTDLYNIYEDMSINDACEIMCIRLKQQITNLKEDVQDNSPLIYLMWADRRVSETILSLR